MDVKWKKEMSQRTDVVSVAATVHPGHPSSEHGCFGWMLTLI